jgi:hypothetical protein
MMSASTPTTLLQLTSSIRDVQAIDAFDASTSPQTMPGQIRFHRSEFVPETTPFN